MNKIIIYISISFVIMMSSCSQNEIEQDFAKYESIEISGGAYLREINLSTVNGDVSAYADFIADTDAAIGISAYKNNQLESNTILAFYNPPLHNTKSEAFVDVSDIKINDIAVFRSKDITKSTKGSIREMFGSKLMFSTPKSQESTSLVNAVDSSLYAPEIISINFPTMQSEDNPIPLCYYQDYVVRWNQDLLNSNGIIILVNWTGSMVFGEDYPYANVTHVIGVPDTGETVLGEHMFDGIPDAAYCKLLLLRGDIDTIRVEDIDISIIAETHDILNFVLIRNIETDDESDEDQT